MYEGPGPQPRARSNARDRARARARARPRPRARARARARAMARARARDRDRAWARAWARARTLFDKIILTTRIPICKICKGQGQGQGHGQGQAQGQGQGQGQGHGQGQSTIRQKCFCRKGPPFAKFAKAPPSNCGSKPFDKMWVKPVGVRFDKNLSTKILAKIRQKNFQGFQI